MQNKTVIFLFFLAGSTFLTRAQSVKDGDGNEYKTVTLGTQVWMAENLRTTRYSDGTPIPNVTDASGWAALTTPSYCWYNNDSATYAAKYGALYNWYATNAAGNGNKNICPEGWRVPTDDDWTILAGYLGKKGYAFEGERRDIAKAMAAPSGWKAHDIVSNVGHDQARNNSSGFTALPGGYRNSPGAFNYAGSYAYWWSSTEHSDLKALYRFIHNYYSYLGRSNFRKQNGFSVRCVCETSAEPQSQSQPVRQIQNPYERVDWTKHGQYKANLNAHTMVSDGWMNPQSVVEEYKKSGYRILAITDAHAVTYPWEEFSKLKAGNLTFSRIYHMVLKPLEENPITRGETDFRDISPSNISMVAIPGCELSFEKHGVNSYFNDHNSSDGNLFEATAAKNGLMVLKHPGQHQFPAGWYVGLYKRYRHLAGIEVFNSEKRFNDVRQLWDSILTVMAPVRPVFGFSNDDLYSMRDLGRNWNVFLLPELNEQEVRRAMEKGIFYLVHAPQGTEGLQPPVIKSIEVDQEKGTIRIESHGQNLIVWISNGMEIGRGAKFSVKKLPVNSSYVRAELYGAGNSVVCTQPFFIK